MSEVVPIGEEERRKLTIKFRAPPLPYEEIADLLRRGFDVFVSGMTTKKAYYAKRRLGRLVGQRINAWPATFDRNLGYLFSTKSGEEIVGRRKIASY